MGTIKSAVAFRVTHFKSPIFILCPATNSVVGRSPWGTCPFFPTQSRH